MRCLCRLVLTNLWDVCAFGHACWGLVFRFFGTLSKNLRCFNSSIVGKFSKCDAFWPWGLFLAVSLAIKFEVYGFWPSCYLRFWLFMVVLSWNCLCFSWGRVWVLHSPFISKLEYISEHNIAILFWYNWPCSCGLPAVLAKTSVAFRKGFFAVGSLMPSFNPARCATHLPFLQKNRTLQKAVATKIRALNACFPS